MSESILSLYQLKELPKNLRLVGMLPELEVAYSYELRPVSFGGP